MFSLCPFAIAVNGHDWPHGEETTTRNTLKTTTADHAAQDNGNGHTAQDDDWPPGVSEGRLAAPADSTTEK